MALTILSGTKQWQLAAGISKFVTMQVDESAGHCYYCFAASTPSEAIGISLNMGSDVDNTLYCKTSSTESLYIKTDAKTIVVTTTDD